MIAVRFGLPARRMVGLVHPPSGPADRNHCVLLCNPFGQEAIRAHRFLKVLADRLCRAGFHVMRFDYYGTGDSEGDDVEGDLETWADDVLRASEEVRLRSGHRQVSWFGLRLGATLAAMASARATSAPSQLVLWDAVVDGPAYLEELADAHAAETKVLHGTPPGAGKRPPVGPDGATEALGFPLTPSLQSQIRGVSVSVFAASRASGIHIIDGGPGEEPVLAGGRVGTVDTPVTVTRIGARISWASDEAMDTAIVPMDALQAVVASLSRIP